MSRARVTRLAPVRLGGVRLPPVRLPHRPDRRWWWLAPLSLLAWLLFAGLTSAGQGDSSSLAPGYIGPRVEVAFAGHRTNGLMGLCEVAVRDISGSVTGSIDPNRQIDIEVTTTYTALAATATADDHGAGIAFDDTATSSGIISLGDPAILQVLRGRSGGGGTMFEEGLGAAAAALADCPNGTTRHVTLITDGESSDDDINAGLAAVPPGVSIDIVALGGASAWSQRQAIWTRTGATLHIIVDLEAKVVAVEIASIIADLTGLTPTVQFEST